MRRGVAVAAGSVLAPLLAVLESGTGAVGHGRWATDDRACQVCHPGPTDGLRKGVHGALMDAPQRACSGCHEAGAHLRAALEPALAAVRPPAVARAACASCHGGGELEPARAAHGWWRVAQGEPQAAPDVELVEDQEWRMEWSALIAAGYRFLDRSGSRERYKTDVNLDRGWRLTEFEISGTARGEGPIDLFRLEASDIADPYQRLGARIEKKESYRGEARYRKSAVTYRGGGDYHRVDRKQQDTLFDLAIEPAADLRLFGSFERASDEGFWLTNRIGNRNVTPLTSIAGVASPRRFDGDRSEIGVTAHALTLAFAYRDDRQRDRWTFARPSPINPAFPESEDFGSRSTLRGPEARAALAQDFGPLTIEANARVLDLERRILGAGVARGFDTTDFVTTTDATATGDAQTWLLDTTAALDLSDDVALHGDLRWLDHEEDLAIRQTDVTFFPSLGTTTSVLTALEPRTAQRTLEGSVLLEVQPHAALDLGLGYGFAREWLRVPDFEAGDADFQRGLIQNDGLLANAAWRPDAHWTLRGEFRGFGQNGVQLHELAEDRSRSAKSELRWAGERLTLSTFLQHRRRENDIVPSSLDATTTGVNGTLQLADGAHAHAGWTFTDLQTRALTNFYFDPDPNPRPTFVGFTGDTHTVHGGFDLAPDERVRWSLAGAYTTTRGSFAVDLLDLQAELVVKATTRGEAGIRSRWLDYDETGLGNDHDALLTLLFWRQRF